jgi:hypothetical protein
MGIVTLFRSTHSAGQIIGVFKNLVELCEVPDNHVSMALKNRESDKQHELVRVAIRPQHLAGQRVLHTDSNTDSSNHDSRPTSQSRMT